MPVPVIERVDVDGEALCDRVKVAERVPVADGVKVMMTS